MAKYISSRSLLLLLLILVLSFAKKGKQKKIIKLKELDIEWSFVSETEVETCPKEIKPLKNVDKNKLVGTWFAFATTALDTHMYQRRCASYNIQNNPYFDTEIIFTDYENLVATYSCIYNPTTELNDVKLRLLTRTRTPTMNGILAISRFLRSVTFPVKNLEFLKSVAYCFEWYILKYRQRPNPGQFNVPIDPSFAQG